MAQQDNEEDYNAFVGSWFVNAVSWFDSIVNVVCNNVEPKFRKYYDETPNDNEHPWMTMLSDSWVKDPTTKAGR
jgi:hypothetical protein